MKSVIDRICKQTGALIAIIGLSVAVVCESVNMRTIRRQLAESLQQTTKLRSALYDATIAANERLETINHIAEGLKKGDHFYIVTNRYQTNFFWKDKEQP